MSDMEMNTSEPREGSVGPVIGTIIILAVIVLGGLYFWSQRGTPVMEEADVDAVVEEINTQEASNEPASIEADLEATDVDNLDSQLN